MRSAASASVARHCGSAGLQARVTIGLVFCAESALTDGRLCRRLKPALIEKGATERGAEAPHYQLSGAT